MVGASLAGCVIGASLAGCVIDASLAGCVAPGACRGVSGGTGADAAEAGLHLALTFI